MEERNLGNLNNFARAIGNMSYNKGVEFLDCLSEVYLNLKEDKYILDVSKSLFLAKIELSQGWNICKPYMNKEDLCSLKHPQNIVDYKGSIKDASISILTLDKQKQKLFLSYLSKDFWLQSEGDKKRRRPKLAEHLRLTGNAINLAKICLSISLISKI